MISKLEGFHVMSVNTTMRWVEEGKMDVRKRETEIKSPTASLASLVAQLVKNLPPVWETWVRSLGWEDPLEKGMATHFSILAWRIPWTV